VAQTQAIEGLIATAFGRGTFTGTPDTFTGDRVSAFTPLQEQAIDPQALSGFLDTFSADRGIPLQGETNEALGGLLRGEGGGELISPERAGEVFQQTRVAPRQREFRDFQQPLIEEQFAGPGFQSTARAQEVSRAGERVGQDLASERAGFLFDVENANRALQEGRASRTLSSIPFGFQAGTQPEQVAGARLAGRGSVFDFAGAEQRQQQQEIFAEQEAFADAQRFFDPGQFEQIMGLLGIEISNLNQRGRFSTTSASGDVGGGGGGGGK
jgi:hypothetical protein